MKPNFLKVTALEKGNHELKKLRLDNLTSRHKSIFLKYLNVKEWVDTEEVQALMTMELNKISVFQTATTWILDMQRWVENVKNKFSDYMRTKCPTSFSSEEKILIQQLKDEKIYIPPTDAELSCILDHLEIAGDSPKLWATLSLELEAENSQRTETYWEKNFSRISLQLLMKQQILQNLTSYKIGISSKILELTPLELRLSIFVKPQEKINIENDSTLNCRVCLNFSDRMSYIFEDTHNEMALVEKMCLCADVSMIVKDDGLPQYICSSCLQLLNSAYTFRTLCEKSDHELRVTEQNQIKEEINEYCASVLDDTIQNDLSDNELKNNDIEIMLSGDELETNEDALPMDEEMPMNDQSSNASQVSLSQKDQYYERVPFPEQEYDGSVKTEDNSTEIVEEPTDDGSVGDDKRSVPKLSLDINLQCETCGRICSSSRTLRIHSKSHSAMKNFKCIECSKDFKTRLALTIHMRMHTGERPYICETCGKAFKTVSAVNNHRAIHSIVKEFQCKQCSYRACTKANLNIHERTHTGVQPYSCRFCALKFSTASNMHKHIRNIHEKLKTHKCDQCDRSFFTRESARKHMVTHTGLRPYTCSLCKMSYGWYNGLQKHMKMIHPGNKMPTEKSFFVKSDKI